MQNMHIPIAVAVQPNGRAYHFVVRVRGDHYCA
jgi:hypothetical protein